MLRFYLLLIVYVLLEISTFLFVEDYTQFLTIIIVSTLIFNIILFWGVASIKSQMFVSSFNHNYNAIGKVAISFDDGPHNENTEKLLDILDKYNAKGNFFLIGENISKYPELAKKIHNSGHLIGNHSYYHKNNFPFQKRKKIEDEINLSNKEIERITGQKSSCFRPPFGVTNTIVAKAMANTKMQVVGWSIRTFDTKNSLAKEKILNTVISKLKSGDIILLHDKSQHIFWLTEEILKYLAKNNLKAVTIDEMM